MTSDRIETNISTTSAQETLSLGSYDVVNNFKASKLRTRTVILSATKLKPFADMNVFLSGTLVNSHFTPCTMVEVSTTGAFAPAKGQQYNDNILLRTTSINSYDTILKGDVITCLTGSAIVISDETIYDKTLGANKRILYVTNVKGTISGTITGSVSMSTGTVVSVSSGSRTTNSLGNIYGALVIPAFTFDSGIQKILLSDANTPDTNASSTMADAAYISNGDVYAHTKHNKFGERTVTSVVDRTKTTEFFSQS